MSIVFPSRVLGYMGGGGMLAGIFSLSFLELEAQSIIRFLSKFFGRGVRV